MLGPYIVLISLSISLVTPKTLGNDPIASLMWLDDDCAAKSLPFPTVAWGLGSVPDWSRRGASTHGTLTHSVPGYSAWKHPRLGKGFRDMDARQACRSDCFVGASARQGTTPTIRIQLARVSEKCVRFSMTRKVRDSTIR